MILWPDEGGRARTPEHIAVYSKKQKNTPALFSESGFASGSSGKALCVLESQLLTGNAAGLVSWSAQTAITQATEPVA